MPHVPCGHIWTTFTALAAQLGAGAAGPRATGAAENNAGIEHAESLFTEIEVPTVLAYEERSETGDSGPRRLGED